MHFQLCFEVREGFENKMTLPVGKVNKIEIFENIYFVLCIIKYIVINAVACFS